MINLPGAGSSTSFDTDTSSEITNAHDTPPEQINHLQQHNSRHLTPGFAQRTQSRTTQKTTMNTVTGMFGGVPSENTPGAGMPPPPPPPPAQGLPNWGSETNAPKEAKGKQRTKESRNASKNPTPVVVPEWEDEDMDMPPVPEVPPWGKPNIDSPVPMPGVKSVGDPKPKTKNQSMKSIVSEKPPTMATSAASTRATRDKERSSKHRSQEPASPQQKTKPAASKRESVTKKESKGKAEDKPPITTRKESASKKESKEKEKAKPRSDAFMGPPKKSKRQSGDAKAGEGKPSGDSHKRHRSSSGAAASKAQASKQRPQKPQRQNVARPDGGKRASDQRAQQQESNTGCCAVM